MVIKHNHKAHQSGVGGSILIPQHLTTGTRQTNKYKLPWIVTEVWCLKQGHGTDNGQSVLDSVSHCFTAFYCLVTQCQQMCLHNLYCLSLTSCQHVCGNNWRLKLKTGFGLNRILNLKIRCEREREWKNGHKVQVSVYFGDDCVSLEMEALGAIYEWWGKTVHEWTKKTQLNFIFQDFWSFFCN